MKAFVRKTKAMVEPEYYFTGTADGTMVYCPDLDWPWGVARLPRSAVPVQWEDLPDDVRERAEELV